MGQADTVITIDLAIYSKAKEIQWRFPNEFSHAVVRMGGLHTALNCLSLLGKKYADSGLDDLLIESGVSAAGSTSTLMKGKPYSRGIRAHKLCLEVFIRLTWNAFLAWYESQEKRIQKRTSIMQDCGLHSNGREQQGKCSRLNTRSVRKVTYIHTYIHTYFI